REYGRHDSKATWPPVYVGLAYYRAGRFDDALANFRKQMNWEMAWPLLAMTCQRLGKQAEAREWLDKADQWYAQSMQAAIAGQTTVGMPQFYVWDRPQFQLLHREAQALLAGSADPDPWQHLIEARGYRLIGETEKSDAAFAAAAAASPNDADVWVTRARLLAQWDEQERSSEADWQKAVELAGDDPLPWIQRGRWYAERGEQEKADADFAKAASLTPNELNKFLEAGWWVVGPYPQALAAFCPPEIDPDPSRPVHVIDPASGLSDQPVAWRSVTPAGYSLRVERGHPVLDSNQQQVSMYAVTCVYSPDERSSTLFVGGDDLVRVWLNGRLVHETNRILSWVWDQDRVPVTLRQGRNTLLVKVNNGTGNYFFRLRLADGPIDRAEALAEHGLWKEAAGALPLEKSNALADVSHSGRCAALLLAAGDIEGYRRQCTGMLERFGSPSNASAAFVVATAVGLHPDGISDMARLVELARKGQVPGNANERWRLDALARAHYRAGEFQQAIDVLSESPDACSGRGWAILAMAHHRLGQTAEAREWLAKLETWYGRATQDAVQAAQFRHWHGTDWWSLAWDQIAYREAKTLIDGAAFQEDTHLQALQARAREQLATRNPLTASYDHALMLKPEETRLWLARGRRLAELGRFDEAEADFNKAAELAPDDHTVATARAAFLAERGDVPRAADAFRTALDSASAKDWANLGRIVEDELSRRPEVLDELLLRNPQEGGLHRIRAESLARQALWREARQSYSSGSPHWLHEKCNAALSRLLGDEAGYEQACRRHSDLRLDGKSPELAGFSQVGIRGLRPVEPAEAAELLRLVENEPALGPLSRQRSFAMGLALYRGGKHEPAIESLSKALEPHSDWQRDAFVWPVLAMAHWQLGRQDEARKWLARSETWIDLTHRAAGIPLSVGPYNTFYDVWLYAHALHFEAKALIDGPASAQEALDLLAPQAGQRTIDVQAKAEARRRDAVARHGSPSTRRQDQGAPVVHPRR
ncbi:MAG: tetratricopeptide repeat protein, partial [Planctomycetes bacterium]|nr:tetratricopeptide repeat protein [Planctomycetota bacterium]